MIKQAACNKKALRNLLLTFNNIIINYAFLFIFYIIILVISKKFGWDDLL